MTECQNIQSSDFVQVSRKEDLQEFLLDKETEKIEDLRRK